MAIASPVSEDRGYDTPCLVWQGAIATNGYGASWDAAKGVNRSAHVIAWEAVNGPVPDGLELDHLCRVRACVRSDHLEPVTRAVNTQRGARAKLTVDDVRRLRELAARGARHADLATTFGIARPTVSNVVARRRWANV